MDEMTKAEMKHEFREMYKNIGFQECLQVLYELLLSSQLLTEVLYEEVVEKNENNEKKEG